MSQQDKPLLQRKPSLWTTLVAVLWSFFGVRRQSAFDADVKALNPFHIVVVGIGACFVFVIALMLFVQWVVKIV